MDTAELIESDTECNCVQIPEQIQTNAIGFNEFSCIVITAIIIYMLLSFITGN